LGFATAVPTLLRALTSHMRTALLEALACGISKLLGARWTDLHCARTKPRVAGFKAVGSLAGKATSFLPSTITVWGDLRLQLLAALKSDSDLEVVTAAAHAAGALLDAKLWPVAAQTTSCATWFTDLLEGTHARLQTPEVAFDSVTARELLTLLGNVHRCVPRCAVEGVVQKGRFNQSCSLVKSAGDAVTTNYDGPISSQLHLTLGVLSAWKGIIAFMYGLPASDVEAGFSQWVGQLVEFLAWALGSLEKEGEAFESSMDVLGCALQLAKQVRGQTASTLLPLLHFYNLLLQRACGVGSAQQSSTQRYIESLAEELGLFPLRHEAPVRLKVRFHRSPQ